MAFRTLEITKPSEIHVKESQLLITQEENTFSIPLEDLNHIICMGPNIRLSTMAISKITSFKIILVILDEKYMPSVSILPFEGHTRQALILKKQILISEEKKQTLWHQIIKMKITNQQRVLAMIGRDGIEEIDNLIQKLNINNVDETEALAARIYFYNIYTDFNRRVDHPLNSKLNYGYATIRCAIIKSLAASGFNIALGLHHDSQLNSFNLADDLIEPYRAMVDYLALQNVSNSIKLSKIERKEMASVLFNACLINKTKYSVLKAIDIMIESLKRIIVDNSKECLLLPQVYPSEMLSGIIE